MAVNPRKLGGESLIETIITEKANYGFKDKNWVEYHAKSDQPKKLQLAETKTYQ